MKYIEIEYTEYDEIDKWHYEFETAYFRYDDEQKQAEEFCKSIKKRNGMINIKITER